ncbi:MAG: chemotaxis protein CheW [Polyangiaceae bacterium]|nr:chemotaxis protein CheW [Polyangiaceae bacterium]
MSMRSELERELSDLKRRLYELERAALDVGAEEPLPASGELLALVCRVEESRVALPLRVVERVVPAAATAPLPESPPWVHGLLRLRGQAIPVLDAAARFARRGRALDVDDQIVICRGERGQVGLVVSEVHEVRGFALDGGAGARLAPDVPQAPYVRATLQDAGGLVLLLSLERLLATSDIPADDSPGAEPPAPPREEAGA